LRRRHDTVLKLLIDTSVILDVLLKRGRRGVDGAALLSGIQMGRAEGYVAAHCITTLHYIVARESGSATARLAVASILQILSVVPLGDRDFHVAVALAMPDFEDAVQAAAALAAHANYIVTGNRKDFRRSPVPPRTAAEVLPLVGASERL
jgi:predicted nucleic acid-binding protein